VKVRLHHIISLSYNNLKPQICEPHDNRCKNSKISLPYFVKDLSCKELEHTRTYRNLLCLRGSQNGN